MKIVKNALINLKLKARFNLFISLLLIVIFSVLGYYLYVTQKADIFKNSDKQLRVMLEDLINIFEVQTSLKQKNIESSMKYALSSFYDEGSIEEAENEFIDLELVSKSGKIDIIKVKKWYLNGTVLQYNYDFVDKVKGGGVDFATIFQKTEKGFVRISTNVYREDDSTMSTRAVGTLLPYNSPIVEGINDPKLKRYSGRLKVEGKWYLTSYVPIFVNSQILGILGIGVNQIDHETLKPLFYNKTYFESGYPYVVSGDGFSVINKTGIEGKNLVKTKFFKQLVKSKADNKERFRYQWPEKPKEGEEIRWKQSYFKYFEPLDLYIATSLYENELYTGLKEMTWSIFYAVLISILIFFSGISLIFRPVTNSIERLSNIISTMSLGKLVSKIYYPKRDEIGDIINSLNKLINGLSNTAKFANEIEKGNFGSKFSPLSDDDTLGNALLDMRYSLHKAQIEETKRKTDDEKRKWTSDGLTIFNDILRTSSKEIYKLSDEIMHNLIKYLHANQGGLFILTRDNEFDLISAYAYDRKKIIKKTVLLGEGLIGTCAIEKDTIHLTEIPEDYIEIESGLGTSNPRSLLIVPLKLDNKVFGVLELASFQEFKENEISFVERLGENIASTLSTAKMNDRTQNLLRESQKQSEELSFKEEQMRISLAELQETQEESAKRQAEMSGVVSALDSSFLVSELDVNGKIIKMNEAFLSLFKLNKNEVVGRLQSELIILDDTQKEKYDDFWKNIRNGSDSIKIQSKHISEFREYWLSETYTPIVDNNGIPYKVLNIAIDITQNKKQEMEIQKLLLDSRRKAKKLSKQEKLNSFNVEKLAKTQAESAKKEAELKNMLDAIDNIALRGEFDEYGNILFVNDNYLNLTGYTLDEMVGKKNKSFLPVDEMINYENMWSIIREGKTYSGVVKRKTKSGEVIWLILSYSPISDRNEQMNKVVFLGTNITKQKNAEAEMSMQANVLLNKQTELEDKINEMKKMQTELENNKHEVDALLNVLNTSSLIMYLDTKGKILDCNQLLIDETQISKENILNKYFLELYRDTSKEENYKNSWSQVLKGKDIQLTNKIKNEQKIHISTESFIPVINDNGMVYKVIHIETKTEFEK